VAALLAHVRLPQVVFHLLATKTNLQRKNEMTEKEKGASDTTPQERKGTSPILLADRSVVKPTQLPGLGAFPEADTLF
jgi:hypothetical protein